MVHIILSISALLAGVMLLLLGNGLLGTLVGIRLTDWGTATWVSGLIQACYFAGLVGGALFGRSVIRGVGHIRAFSAFASTFSAATMAHAFLESAPLWAGLRFVEGFCMAGLFMCAESWLNEKATNATRGAVLSIYSITVFAAQGLGQFLLQLYDPAGFALFALASVLLSLALVPVALTRVPGPALPPLSVFPFSRLWRISPLGVVGAVAGGATLGCFLAMGPIYARQIGIEVNDIAYFMSAAILGGFLLQWPVGRLSDRFDRRKVIVGLSLVTAVSSLAVPVAATLDHGAMMGVLVIFGAGMFILYPMAVANANDFIETKDLVSASGGLLLAYSVGATIGPLLASAAMDQVGPSGLFHTTAAIGLLTSGFGLYRLTRRSSPEAQAPFMDVSRTTQVAHELDPRGADMPEQDFDYTASEADIPAHDEAEHAGTALEEARRQPS